MAAKRPNSSFKAAVHPSWAIVFAALGVLFGDILIHIFRYSFFGSMLWLFVALFTIFFVIKFSRKIFLPLAFLAGIILISFRATPDFVAEKALKDAIGQEITISAKVLKDPNFAEDKTTLVLSDILLPTAQPASPASMVQPTSSQSDDSRQQTPLPGRLFASLPKDPKTASKIQRGDRLTLKGKLTEGFGTYAATIYRPAILVHEKGEDIFLKVRDALAEKVEQSLPEKEAGLALGYLLGIKSGVDKDFEETLRVVGLTHIIVASGTHLSILASFARRLFGRATRFLGFLGAGTLILIFVGITGLTPSMSRAAPVALLSLLAWYLGRDRSPGRVLLAVAAGTLLIDPTNLLDLAWLLSFASFTGIMVLSPLVSNLFYGTSIKLGSSSNSALLGSTQTTKKPGYFAELIISSLAATFACAPILLYFFGSISLISIFANLLILPTISIVMGLTLVTGLFNLIALTPLAEVSAFFARIILDYHFAVVEFLGEQKFFLIGTGSTGTGTGAGTGTGVGVVPGTTFSFAGSPLVFLFYIPLIILIFVSFFIRRRRLSRGVLTV